MKKKSSKSQNAATSSGSQPDRSAEQTILSSGISKYGHENTYPQGLNHQQSTAFSAYGIIPITLSSFPVIKMSFFPFQ